MRRAVFFALTLAVTAVSATYRRWDNQCLDVENGARYCFETQLPCHGESIGECPKAGTHASARCTEFRPSFHMDGPYEGRCVLSVDTVCVKRGDIYKCVFPDIPVEASTETEIVQKASHASTEEHSQNLPYVSTNDSSFVIAGGVIAAVAAIAFFIHRKRQQSSGNASDSEGSLTTPAIPHPDETPELYSNGKTLTPTLLRDKPRKPFSV